MRAQAGEREAAFGAAAAATAAQAAAEATAAAAAAAALPYPPAAEPPPLSEGQGAFAAALSKHDRAVAARGLRLWLGGEPTFTDRSSQEPHWLGSALGGDKEARARALAAALLAATPGAFVVRSIGRQYPGEPRPRWSYGIYARRSGEPWWQGPPDPLVAASGAGGETPPRAGPEGEAARSRRPAAASSGALGAAARSSARALRDRLAERLRWRGVAVGAFELGEPVARAQPARAAAGAEAALAAAAPSADSARVCWRVRSEPGAAVSTSDPRLYRRPLDEHAIPESGLVDDLAADGVLLIGVSPAADEPGALAVELPAFPDAAAFQSALADLAAAAHEERLPSLVLSGFPPPVDPGASFTTITPDPGVIEVNMAPADSAAGFLAAMRTIHRAAASIGLSSVRLFWNGDWADSGGGGHLTLGGPSAAESPFVVEPCLVPALVAYVNRHPSLSYLFAVASVGSSSQAPRADEGVREATSELDLALRRLARRDDQDPERTWRALQPFLCDRSGNTHRAEVNVEKLWNPHWPGRGRMGLVELRALRMAETPEEAAALGALFRAVVAMLAGRARGECARGLHDWGAELHDRFALLCFLEQDLDRVLADLDQSGLGLGPPLVETLLAASARRSLGEAALGPVRLVARRGLEFWPLVGDVASQERGTARMVDASAARVEVLLRPVGRDAAVLGRVRVECGGFAVTLVPGADRHGPLLVAGIRYRAFVPNPGLHPGLEATDPLVLTIVIDGEPQRFRVAIHGWEPTGAAYTALPADLAEARARRAARFVVTAEPAVDVPPAPPPPAFAETPFAFDLRRATA